jgi:GH35 family endo-1,4-beta-xylanase
MAYDNARRMTVLFGGYASYGFDGETWEWNGDCWTYRANTGPYPVYDHAVAYVHHREALVIYGGRLGGWISGDLWEWDGIDWIYWPYFPGYPSPRYGHAMVYDPDDRRIVLFGGYDGENFLGDTWEWSGSHWALVHPGDPDGIDAPSPRAGHAMVWDEDYRTVRLFGGQSSDGYSDETWEWDGYWWWKGPPGPCACSEHAMAFDSQRAVTVVHALGENGQANWTWEWSGYVWFLRETDAPVRLGHVMAYDTARGLTVLFGGVNGADQPYSDTLEWDGTAWVTHPIQGPPPAAGHSMTYDSARQKAVLFCAGETWEYGHETTLRDLLPEGVLFGGAVDHHVKPEGKPSYHGQRFKLHFSESFNLATLENEHKAGVRLPGQDHSMWRGPDEYDFSEADKIVEWCLDNDQPIIVKFHTLVWDNPHYDDDQGRWVNDGVPDWLLDGVSDDPNDPNAPYDANDVRGMLRDYIDAVLKHYCGDARYSDRPDLKIELYDVVNEWFDQREDEDGPRENWWEKYAGEEVLEFAFIWADETATALRDDGVDFEPVLIYNDFDLIPDPNNPNPHKPDLVYTTLESLRDSGVPIDAIGFQSHFCRMAVTEDFCDEQVFPEFDRYQKAGFGIYVSEFDVGDADAEEQREYYENYLTFCLNFGTRAFQMWDFWDGDADPNDDDPDPWCRDECADCKPGIFDGSWNRKPSYYGFYDALSTYGSGLDGAGGGTDVDPVRMGPVPPP